MWRHTSISVSHVYFPSLLLCIHQFRVAITARNAVETGRTLGLTSMHHDQVILERRQGSNVPYYSLRRAGDAVPVQS